MAEAPDNSSNNNGSTTDSGASTDTTTTTTADTINSEVDLSKLSGDQLAKVLENPELFKLPRIATLLEDSKNLKKLSKDQEAAREKALEEQKKFEDLANERGSKIETLEKQLQDQAIANSLTALLVKENVIDLDAALKLVDRNKVTVNEDGSLAGAEDAINALKADKAYLFNNQGGTLGTPSNPSSSQASQPGGYKFKESQITPEFYKAHEKEILEAYRNGQIEADGPPQL